MKTLTVKGTSTAVSRFCQKSLPFQRTERVTFGGKKLRLGNNCSMTHSFAARTRRLLGHEPLGISQDAFLSEASDFSLKIHDSLKPGATIAKLGRVQSKVLGEVLDLECDQIIDFASQGKEPLLSHRHNCSPT
jgi:hypothetical protein